MWTKPIFEKSDRRKFEMIAVLIILMYSIILLPANILFNLVREDQVIEYLTAFFFLISSVGFLMLFLQPKYLKNGSLKSRFTSRGRRYFFLLLCIVFFFGFGEEISWGQRIFGFNPQNPIAELNIQQETNIHNLPIFSAHGKDGSEKDIISKLFTMKQLFLYCFATYLFILPVLNASSKKIKSWMEKFYIPLPTIVLGILFVGNYALYRLLRLATDNLHSNDFNNALTEIQEFNFSIILLFLPLYWLKLRQEKQ